MPLPVTSQVHVVFISSFPGVFNTGFCRIFATLCEVLTINLNGNQSCTARASIM